MSEGWIPIDQAAQYLSVSPDTVRRMISRGEIDARRIGPRLIRVDVHSLLRNAKPLAVVA